MSALASYRPNVAYRGVEKTPPPIVRLRPAMSARLALGQAIRRLRKRADITQEQAAANMDVVVQTWRRYEWGERDLPLEKLDAVAAAVNATRDELLALQLDLLHGEGSAQVLSTPSAHPWTPPPTPANELGMLPVRDRVQAGAWLLADDLAQDGRHVPVVRDPRYPNANQWVDLVVGDSVNRLNIFDGDFVHLVDAIEIGYSPTTGDVVEVERLRFGGQERELTLKQVEVTPLGVQLWPRSTNPRWQEAISVSYGLAEDEEEFEVRIRAKVISAFRRF